MNLMAMRVTEMGASEGCPVIGQIDGCVASWGQHHLAGNGADFLLVLNSRTLEEPMHEAKQMTTGQPVGAASHTTGGFSTAVRVGSKSVSSRSASFLNQAASSFFMGAFLGALAG